MPIKVYSFYYIYLLSDPAIVDVRMVGTVVLVVIVSESDAMTLTNKSMCEKIYTIHKYSL